MMRRISIKSKKFLLLVCGLFILSGCGVSGSASPTLTPIAFATLDMNSNATAIPASSQMATILAGMPTPLTLPSVCTDPQVVTLIDSLRTAMLTANGELLSSLVDPNGMEVRYYRNGRIITYTPAQAKFLFETTYQVDWGADPASGIEKKGSFHDVIVPEMVKIFNQSYTLHCNEIKHGGASYDVTWLYNKDFYSIYYAGTEANGHLDWHTWVVGIDYVDDKPYSYALLQFYWEP